MHIHMCTLLTGTWRSKRAALSQTPAPRPQLSPSTTLSLKMLDVCGGRPLAVCLPCTACPSFACTSSPSYSPPAPPAAAPPRRSTATPFCRRRNSEHHSPPTALLSPPPQSPAASRHTPAGLPARPRRTVASLRRAWQERTGGGGVGRRRRRSHHLLAGGCLAEPARRAVPASRGQVGRNPPSPASWRGWCATGRRRRRGRGCEEAMERRC